MPRNPSAALTRTRPLETALAAALLLGWGGTQTPAWSSEDGSDWDITRAPGAEFEVEVDTSTGTWMNLDLSPDGGTLVFDLLGDLFLLDRSGGDARQITSGPAWDMQPTFSPDGQEIAFTSDRDGANNIWVVSADGERTRQISHETYRLPNHPTWSPDGDFLAARKHFTSRRSLGTGEIWLWHRSGQGAGLQLNEKPNEQKDLGEPAFSPDGRYVYFSQDTTPGDTFQYSKDSNGEIYTIRRIDRTTGEIETIVSGPGGAVNPTPSPDGRKLAFVRRVRSQTTLFIHDLRSGENTPIYAGLDRDMQEIWAIHGLYPNFAWTPDSNAILFWAQGRIWEVELETRLRQEIPFRVQQTHTMKKALRFPIEVGANIGRRNFPVRMLRWSQVSPTGGHIVFQALGVLWIREIRDNGRGPEVGKARRLTTQDDSFEMTPSFSRDGSKIVYSTWNDDELGSVRIVDLQGKELARLTSEPGHYLEPAFSPDGLWVVFRKATGGSIRTELWSKEPGLYRVEADGSGQPVRLSVSGREPHFADDPGRVYFTTRAAQKVRLESLRIEPTSAHPTRTLWDPERQVHVESENATQFRASPDGRWVAFTERYQAFVLPLVAASKPVQVSPETQSLPFRQLSRDAGDDLHWSGDSEGVYWSTGPELFRQDLDQAFDFFEDSPEELPDPPTRGLALGFESAYDTPRGTLALIGGKVVTMSGDEDATIIEPGTVLVRDNRIVAVGAVDAVEVPADAHRVDTRGQVVLPGLIDVHWHGNQGRDAIVPQRNHLNYNSLAFGVTTAHDPSNDTASFFAASELQKSGRIVGPRLFSTGTILYGASGPSRAEVNSLDEARQHLRRLKSVGAFSVKSYNQPRRNQRQLIVAAARELEMMVVNEGGALFNTNMTMVMDGHTGIEHSLSVGAIYDDVKQYWGSSQVGITPTLGVAFGGIEGERYWYAEDEVWNHPRLRRFTPRDRLDARARRVPHAPERDYNHIRAAEVCKDLLDAGVSVQVGAHGQREGLATHWEIWMLGQGGMTELEALQAATIQGARYLGLDGDLGSIEPGKLADLIVLDQDPLVDLRNTDSVAMTLINGRLYDAETMNEIGLSPRTRGKLWFEERDDETLRLWRESLDAP